MNEISVLIKETWEKWFLSHMRLWWKYDHLKTEVGVSQWIVLNSWISRFQNSENINFCCLSHPVYDILLCQPKLTKIQNKIAFFPISILHFTPHNLPNMTVPSLWWHISHLPYQCICNPFPVSSAPSLWVMFTCECYLLLYLQYRSFICASHP